LLIAKVLLIAEALFVPHLPLHPHHRLHLHHPHPHQVMPFKQPFFKEQVFFTHLIIILVSRP